MSEVKLSEYFCDGYREIVVAYPDLGGLFQWRDGGAELRKVCARSVAVGCCLATSLSAAVQQPGRRFVNENEGVELEF